MGHDVAFLEDLLSPEQIGTDETARENHATDWGGDNAGIRVTPDAVVWPTATSEVAAVLAAANDRGVPVTPYAAGTALEGHAVPVERGISMDMTEMDGIVNVRPEDFQIDVQPGVIGSAVDERVARHGLFFPPLPSSGDISTVGGMIATDASGMQTVKYGEVADWLLRMEVVLADGSVIAVGSTAAKTSSGYNLDGLFVGSEGTLGVVTEATLELAGRPAQIRGGRAIFEDLGDAAGAVSDAVRSGVDVAKIELVDALAATMANAHLGTDLPDAPMVFLEFHANHGIDEEIEFCRDIFERYDVTHFEMAGDEAMADLWHAREELAFAIKHYYPDRRSLHPGDVTVPISHYADLVTYVKDRVAGADLEVACFGHAGDGNLHYSIVVDRDDPEMVDRGEAAYGDVIAYAIDHGGTATGEHGIGLGKRQFMEREHGRETLETMRAIKHTLDPNGTLNPGKIVPDEG
jgi:D-lactate dehydrogenase (cytochrome)